MENRSYPRLFDLATAFVLFAYHKLVTDRITVGINPEFLNTSTIAAVEWSDLGFHDDYAMINASMPRPQSPNLTVAPSHENPTGVETSNNNRSGS